MKHLSFNISSVLHIHSSRVAHEKSSHFAVRLLKYLVGWVRGRCRLGLQDLSSRGSRRSFLHQVQQSVNFSSSFSSPLSGSLMDRRSLFPLFSPFQNCVKENKKKSPE
jgi:hypothetical protein